jgi:biopolymer transport protein ExbB/biopolymer transport protein TolQ
MTFELSSVARLGATSVLYILIALSIFSIAVMLDRWIYFRKRRTNFAELATKLADLLHNNQIAEAQELLAKNPSDAAQIARGALERYAEGGEAVEQILAKEIRLQRNRFERGLLFLGTLGNNAPFIGLFGTVLGIVDAFRGLGQSQNAGAMANVMSAIAQALTATAIGILVALPAVVAYNVFQKKAQDVEENASALGNVILADLSTRNHDGAAKHGRPATRATAVSSSVSSEVQA